MSSASVARVFRHWLDSPDFYCPTARALLAAAVLGQQVGTPVDKAAPCATAVASKCPPHGSSNNSNILTLSIEAIGSGIVLLRDLELSPHSRLADLKALISGRQPSVPAHRQRLFIGHGGAELLDDTTPLGSVLKQEERVLTMMLVDYEFQLLVVILRNHRRSHIITVKVRACPLATCQFISESCLLMRLTRELFL